MRNYFATMIAVFVLSACQTEPAIDPDRAQLNSFLSSSSFAELKVSLNDLDIKKFKLAKSQSGKRVIYIPFNNTNKIQFLLGMVLEDNKYFSVISSVESDYDSEVETINALESDTFSGSFNFESGASGYSFTFESSEITSVKKWGMLQVDESKVARLLFR